MQSRQAGEGSGKLEMPEVGRLKRQVGMGTGQDRQSRQAGEGSGKLEIPDDSLERKFGMGLVGTGSQDRLERYRTSWGGQITGRRDSQALQSTGNETRGGRGRLDRLDRHRQEDGKHRTGTSWRHAAEARL
jgi:hypothetical protein